MNDIIKLNGRTYTVTAEPDYDIGAPWEWSEGHGIVSDWTMRDKRSGELVINSDRGMKRFFDYAGTIKQAAREGWGLSLQDMEKLQFKLGRAPTEKEITAQAVMDNYDYLRGWCKGDWCFVTLCVEDDLTGECQYLGGIESSDDEGLREAAQNMAEELFTQWDDRQAEEATL